MSRKLSEVDISAIIEMALSDDVSFSAIKEQYGINEAVSYTHLRAHET